MGSGQRLNQEVDLKWAQLAAISCKREQSLLIKISILYSVFAITLSIGGFDIWYSILGLICYFCFFNEYIPELVISFPTLMLIDYVDSTVLKTLLLHFCMIGMLLSRYYSRINDNSQQIMPSYMTKPSYLKKLKAELLHMANDCLEYNYYVQVDDLEFLLPIEIMGQLETALQEYMSICHQHKKLLSFDNRHELIEKTRDFNICFEKYKQETMPFWEEVLDCLPSDEKEWYQVLEDDIDSAL